jgi:iron only hydrogenase large subunit-like protein
VDSQKKAIINYNLCTHCGACVYNCPFGAIQDKSEILDVIEALKKKTVYAMIAPAFATQFQYANQEQVVSAIKALGFRDVIEVALGADLVVKHEGEELIEKIQNEQIMTTSCCPSFVKYLEITYPELKPLMSHTVSPMVATARIVKELDPEGVTVFIGPCISKKHEKLAYEEVDYVLTFEELSALIDAKEIDISKQEESPLNNASSFGRNFAKASGVLNAIEHYVTLKGHTIKGVAADGLGQCDKQLKLMKFNRFEGHILEGMACKGGCIKGPVTMHHGSLDHKAIENYAGSAHEHTIDNSVELFKVKMT